MLGKDDLSVVKAAAECVSAIASIEIPLKMWDDIIPLLQSNSNSDNFMVRLASIQTLG